MKDLSDVVAVVVDHGLFMVPVAQRLAESMKRVYVVNPSWQTGFSTINAAILGDGFDNIIKVDEIWDVKNEIDLAVYPDIQHAGEQLELESQGKAVWGPRRGDQQELDRELFLRTLKKVGLEVAPHTIVVGLDALEKLLREKEDCYIKISKYRGSHETCHWRSWELDKWTFAAWRVKFGPAGDILPFLVFDNIETDLEIGVDTFTIAGQWPDVMLHGVEGKDKSYLSAVTKRTDMPEQLQDVMNAFGPVFRKTRSRMQFSGEVRVKDDVGYFIDPTCRGGLPSTNSQLLNCRNWPEIIWAGANGELVQPDYEKPYTAEAIVTFKGDKDQWAVTDIPEDLKPFLKLAYVCQINGKACFPPEGGSGDAIGWLVANGDSPKETIETINAYADLLPDGCNADTETLAFVLKEIHEEEAQGIEFGDDEIPKPETVLQDL